MTRLVDLKRRYGRSPASGAIVVLFIANAAEDVTNEAPQIIDIVFVLFLLKILVSSLKKCPTIIFQYPMDIDKMS